jgi:hypothetical protein
LGSHQGGDFAPQPGWQVEPALIPGTDQALAPLAGDDLLHVRQQALWQPAEGIAVQVDFPGICDDEFISEVSQLIPGVQILRQP